MSSEINNLTSEIAQTKSQLAKQEMSEHFFKFDDDKVRFYTGLQTYQILMLIFSFIEPYISVSARSALTPFQQVIMTLMKLRLNLPVQDLAYRFGTSTSTISRVFTLVIDVMYTRLHFLLRWPTRESSRKMRVLAHFTIHMVECIQLYTDQPHTWLGFRHHPSSSVFQPYVWLGTISNSWNNTK